MIGYAVFDADGTLIDSLGVWRAADDVYLASKGKRMTDEIYRAFMKMTYGESITFVKDHFLLPDSEERISADIMRIVTEKYAAEVRAMPGVIPLLDRLAEKGIPMAVATANEKELVTAALSSNGMLGYFRYVVTCDELGTSKRTADVYVHAARLLGGTPEETLVVEDDFGCVKTAAAAGFHAVYISEIGGIELE